MSHTRNSDLNSEVIPTQPQAPIDVWPEPTPNPNSMKFVVNRILLSEPVNFTDAQSAERSPLASKVFGFPWSSGVYIGTDFITITKQDWVEWDMLAEPLAGLLREHFESGEPILLELKTDTKNVSDDSPDDSEDVRIIKKLIREEIQPAVAMDGGDIIFHKFENNNVYIYMRGACSGCPAHTHSQAGIETRMKEFYLN